MAQDKERLVIGICAHVDAGKTTLSEQILYETGVIRAKGRVDNKDAFLDTDEMEKARGITIYAKQAVFPALSAMLQESTSAESHGSERKRPEKSSSGMGSSMKRLEKSSSGMGSSMKRPEDPQLKKDREYTLLDTPGHADFRAETERTMAVLDAAVLLISAADGVTAQVRLLWSMLEHYKVPVFLFVNKMDQAEDAGEGESRREALLSAIREQLNPNAVMLPVPAKDFGGREERTSPVGPANAAADIRETQEILALASEDEDLIEQVLDGGQVPQGRIRKMIADRIVTPVCFGSALRGTGVRELLLTLDAYLAAPDYIGQDRRDDDAHYAAQPGSDQLGSAAGQPRTAAQPGPDQQGAAVTFPFSARAIKISRDEAGERETWMKITGGALHVRDAVTYTPAVRSGENENDTAEGAAETEEGGPVREITEKVTRIRVWNGENYADVTEALPGMVVSAAGLTKTFAGQGFGKEAALGNGLFRPVLRWEILLPQNTDPYLAYRKMQILEEEDPLLSFSYDPGKKALFAVLSGQVQREILADTVFKRFHLAIRYGRPDVICKETIRTAAEGVGHFEPLRHYAEVHLLLEPGEEGSGLVFENACSPDILPRQYQHQIMEALQRRRHRGVLTGAEITDMKITLLAGKAHVKHTGGGDFRQAAGRAVRQGLMMAESVLLEPWYDFEMILPQDRIGRAMADLSAMGAAFGQPESAAEQAAILRGSAPVRAMDAYQEELAAYTKGEGSISLTVGAYRPCVNAEEVIINAQYDPEQDLRQPSASVFCMHGAGTVIPWYMVRDYMQIDTGIMTPEQAQRSKDSLPGGMPRKQEPGSFRERERAAWAAEDELMAIFERTYGPVKRELPSRAEVIRPKNAVPDSVYRKKKPQLPQERYLLVDGYNIIYAWEDLRDLANADVKAARDRLMDILSNYAGFTSEHLILVYDAYRVPGGVERVMPYHNIQVVFTREAETADQYIEKTAHSLTKQYGVRVATSDAIEQMIIYGAGAVRVSARDLLLEIISAEREIRESGPAKTGSREERAGTSLGDLLKDLTQKE